MKVPRKIRCRATLSTPSPGHHQRRKFPLPGGSGRALNILPGTTVGDPINQLNIEPTNVLCGWPTNLGACWGFRHQLPQAQSQQQNNPDTLQLKTERKGGMWATVKGIQELSVKRYAAQRVTSRECAQSSSYHPLREVKAAKERRRACHGVMNIALSRHNDNGRLVDKTTEECQCAVLHGNG